MDLSISIEAFDFGLKHVIRAHTAQCKIPHALLALGAVGMRVDVARRHVPIVLQYLHQEEHRLDTFTAKTQILVIARSLLIVEVNIEEFTSFQSLSYTMHKVESRHLFVSNLWIETNHLGMIEGVDKGQHMPNGGKIGIGAGFIGFWLQCEMQLVALLHHVLTQEVDGVAHAFDRHHRVFAGFAINALASTPEDIAAGP